MRSNLAALTTSIKYGPHLKTAHTGRVVYLKAHHFDADGDLLDVTDSYADPTVELEILLLRVGQLILAGKGNRHFAWAYRTAAGPCIASSLFYVLTVRTERVDPRYLALVLNSASCGRALTAFAKGATVPVIPKRELANLSVPVPPLDQQLAIVKLHDLQQHRRRLMEELSGLNATLDNAHLEQLIYA